MQIGGVPTDIEFLLQVIESESFHGRPGRYHLPGRVPATMPDGEDPSTRKWLWSRRCWPTASRIAGCQTWPMKAVSGERLAPGSLARANARRSLKNTVIPYPQIHDLPVKWK
jgi:hypothetical protein